MTIPGPDLARVGGMIGDPSRAAMLAALLGGPALSAGQLARRAAVSASTASGHLARLIDSGLVRVQRSGRHRFYALAGGDVADALESLARIAPQAVQRDAHGHALRFARTCYDHLAGTLGVMVTETMMSRGLITTTCSVTARGEAWLRGLAIDVDALRRTRRTYARPCLDWSERRDHLAGAVGAAITDVMLERRWIARLDGTRAVRLTLRGREGLYRALALEIDARP